MINSEIDKYLKTQRIGVLAVSMPDGSLHAATIHFAHRADTFIFYFETYRTTRKAESLLGNRISKASLVIGVDESNMKTMQLDGKVQLIEPKEKETYNAIYLGKFPEKKLELKDANVIPFQFIPTWWRFTDWTTPQGKTIVTSEQKRK